MERDHKLNDNLKTLKDHPLRHFLATETPLQFITIAFYFMLKARFIF